MKINFEILQDDEKLRSQLDFLDKDSIHILHFKYKASFKNFWKSPVLIIMKLFNLFDKGAGMDHVCHICRFIKDGKSYQVKVFEATTDRGMEENDLISKLKRFDGTCWIESLDHKVDKAKAKRFEKKYLGVEYSKLAAALAGLDGAANKLNIKTSGAFCSFLVGAFLKDQAIEPFKSMGSAEILELTPSDIFEAGLGHKTILVKK